MEGSNVPGIDSAPQFDTRGVPGVQLPRRTEFGELGRAYESLGGSVEGAARTGADISNEIQRQSDISASSTEYADAQIAHNKYLTGLAKSTPDGIIRDPLTQEPVTNKDGTQRTISQE
jgi:hypothetical protein